MLADQIVESVLPMFDSSVTPEQREQLTRTVGFHLRFVGDQFMDDVGSLVYLECASETPLTEDKFRSIVARVQKRLERKAQREFTVQGDWVIPDPGNSIVSAAGVDRLISRFTDYLKNELTVRDAMVFQAAYIEGKTRDAISAALQISASTYYKHLMAIRAAFLQFMDDEA